MDFGAKDIEHLAHLGRIKLSEKEASQFESQLGSILDFISKLREAATPGILPVTGGVELLNVVRDDKEGIEPLGDPNDLRDAFAKRDSRGYLVVPNVFGHGSN